MSRIGKKTILIPEGVEVKIEGQRVNFKGPKGELSRQILPEIKVELKDNLLSLAPQKQTKQTNAFWGLERSLLANMIIGVAQGFEKRLQIVGIGYRANVIDGKLILEVGYSHKVEILKPEEIEFTVEKDLIVVSGIDKEKVGQVAAKIRRVKPPDSYKGKGIRYLGEKVRLKPGKKAASGA